MAIDVQQNGSVAVAVADRSIMMVESRARRAAQAGGPIDPVLAILFPGPRGRDTAVWP